MTYEDLPKDWPMRSLADPDLAADVVDLVVSDKDRSEGGLSFLLCRADGSLAQPMFIETEGCPASADLVRRVVDVVDHVPEVRGIVIGIAKPFGGVSDVDRQVHQEAIEVCRAQGLTLHGAYLATHAGVRLMPVAAELTEKASGAA